MPCVAGEVAKAEVAVARGVWNIVDQKRRVGRFRGNLWAECGDKAWVAHGRIAFLEMFVNSKSYCAVRGTDTSEVLRSHG